MENNTWHSKKELLTKSFFHYIKHYKLEKNYTYFINLRLICVFEAFTKKNLGATYNSSIGEYALCTPTTNQALIISIIRPILPPIIWIKFAFYMLGFSQICGVAYIQEKNGSLFLNYLDKDLFFSKLHWSQLNFKVRNMFLSNLYKIHDYYALNF